MNRKALAFTLPIGLLIYLVYSITERILGDITDHIAYPIMITGISFMVVGLVYNGYCIGKRKNPYNFKEKVNS